MTLTDREERTDQGLLAAFLGGEREAFERLVGRHAGWVYATARRQLGDDAQAQDATQAVFVLLCRRAKRVAGHPRVSGWLFMAAQFTVRAMKRSERRRRIHERRAMMQRATTAATSEMLAGVLDAAVGQLPEKERAAVILRFYEGQDFAGVAAGLVISEAAARKRVTRAVERLRAKLGPRVTAGSVSAAAMQGMPVHVAAISAAASHGALCAAAGGPVSVGVAGATKGATVLMAATHLKLAVGAAVLLLAAGVVGTWFFYPSAPPRKTVVLPVEAAAPATAEAPKTAPTATFETVYQPGAPGEVVRIPPPFVEGRLEFYRKDDPLQAQALPEGPDGMIMDWSDGKLTHVGMTFGEGRGYTVAQLIDMFLNVYAPNVEGPDAILKSAVSGDFIVRDFDSKSDYRAGLERMLSSALQQPVTLTFADVDRPVYVLHGMWTPHLTSTHGRIAGVEIYGQAMNKDMDSGGGGGGTPQELAQRIGEWIDRTVIVEAEGLPQGVSYHLNDAHDVPESKAKAHDPELVLQHVGEQTGLMVTQETRKVRRLFVAWAK